MKKGKFGLCLSFYAVLAFVLALLKQPLLCGLLLGFVIVAEDDRWAVRQVLQAFMLSLVSTFVLDTVYTLAGILVPYSIGFFYDFAYGVLHVVSCLVYAGVLVLSIMAILRVCRDQEANVPLLSNLSYHVFGDQKPPKPVKQPVWPQQPMQQPYPPQQAPQQPVQGQMPMQGYPMPSQPMQQPQGAAPVPQPMPDMQQTMQIPQVPVTPPAQPAPQPVQTAQPEQQPPQQP